MVIFGANFTRNWSVQFAVFWVFCEFTWIFFGSTTTQNIKSPEYKSELKTYYMPLTIDKLLDSLSRLSKLCIFLKTITRKEFEIWSKVTGLWKSRFKTTVKTPLMATSQQQPFFLVDSPYIHSCFNLSTMATFLWL